VGRPTVLPPTNYQRAILRSPQAVGVASTAAFGQGEKLPRKIVEVLNFALTLEYLEFYRTALGSDNLIPAETKATFETIGKHEAAHVELLKGALGSRAAKKPSFDFTAKGAFGDVFSNYKTFLALSQAFEDTGVRAYKGQAGNLKASDEILTTALQIHSVEARHAAEVRLIRGQPAWIVSNSRGACLKRPSRSMMAKQTLCRVALTSKTSAACRQNHYLAHLMNP
jgi:rubrerythrin